MSENIVEPRLTPLQVEKTVFPRRAFGYDRGAVDAFRRDVAKEMERLVQRVRQLEQSERELLSEVGRFRELETTLKEAVLLGQRAADETRAAAHAEADAVLSEARAVARQLQQDAELQVQQMRQEVARLQAEREGLVAGLRALLEGFAARLETFMPATAAVSVPREEVQDGAVAARDAPREP